MITVSNKDRKNEPFREINKNKRFLKQVKLVQQTFLCGQISLVQTDLLE